MSNNLTFHHNLNNLSFVKVMLCGILLSALFNIDASSSILFWLSTLLVLIIMSSVIFIPLNKILYPLFILIISMPDVTQSAEQIASSGPIIVASAWQFIIGPITPSTIVLLPILIVLTRLFKFSIKKNPYKYIFLFFLIVSPIISVWFGFFQESFSRFITDAKVPIFLFSGLLIFNSYYKRFPEYLKFSCQIFIALAAGNFIFDLIKLFFFYPENFSVNYISLTYDSAKGLITIFTFLAITRIIENKNLIFNLFIVLISLYILISYQTRWLIVTFLIGLVLVFIFISYKKFITSFFVIIIFVVITTPILIAVNPEIFRIALLRFSFISNITADSSLIDVEIVRAGSIYNSINLLWEQNAFFTGMGYGSWYDDSYFPMLNLSASAFDDASISSGKYYRIHDFFFHFLFKFGIIGTFLYISLLVKPLVQFWKLATYIRKNPIPQKITLLFIGLSPIVLTNMYWTSKGLLFTSLYIVLAYEWIKVFKITSKIENT